MPEHAQNPAKWLQISLDCTPADVDPLEDALLEAGAVSVTLGDAADQPLLEPGPGETPLWEALTVTALFDLADSGAAAEAVVASVRETVGRLGDASERLLGTLNAEELPDEVWERSWMSHFKAMPFGKRLWVVPSWDTTSREDAIELRLDPGLAFGTGTHPTTAMCLSFLDTFFTAEQYSDFRARPPTVIDFGCGSGILGIAALLLGAASALAVDIDPQALIATRENARLNAVDERLHCVDIPELAGREADLVVANILAGPLIELASKLAGMVRPGGHLVLSGVLADQAGKVQQAYREHGIELQCNMQEDWCCLHGRRNIPSSPMPPLS
ncbi:MAG: 50S ribosomal protein L11 methyltransferase [unclassified Hahellaceae]|nr:50S ribosomal protein L11 methyltransferase [Hahellaceae bacterium]|tara:strand:- start:20381 stop:21367 length:987 start_codon:yes stop_codon:yes gene_type:complete